jgi:hypothetical protein
MYVACSDLATAGLCGISFKRRRRAAAFENAIMGIKRADEIKMRRKPRLRQHILSIATDRKDLTSFDLLVDIQR